MNRPDDRYHDPGMIPTGRPSRIPNLFGGLRDSGRVARTDAVLSRSLVARDPHTLIAPARRTSSPIGQPLPSVRNLHGKAEVMYQEPQLPENVVKALAALVAHAHHPGSIPYSDVGQHADLVRDYFDLA